MQPWLHSTIVRSTSLLDLTHLRCPPIPETPKAPSVMFFLRRTAPNVLKLSTNDWSQLDSDEAPTQEEIIYEYETRFRCEVSLFRATADGAPQLQLRLPIDDIEDAPTAIEAMFRGENLVQYSAAWWALQRRLDPILNAHEKSNPVFHFSPAAAAVAAFKSKHFGTSGKESLRIEGYRAIPQRELKGGALSPVVSLGQIPKDKISEGGHLFRFPFNDSSQKEPKRIADLTLIEATGIHQSFLFEGRRPQVNSFTGKILYTPNRVNKLPTYFRARPAVQDIPPASHRMTFRAGLSEEDRVLIETALDRRVELLETGAHEIHVDLSDVPDWPELRARLLSGENVAAERERYNVIAARLRSVFKQSKASIYHPADAAAVLALEAVQDGSERAIRRGVSFYRRLEAPSVKKSGITNLRLGGIGTAHAYQLEKMPDSIHWPTENVPYPLERPETLTDMGHAISFYVNGVLQQVLVEP